MNGPPKLIRVASADSFRLLVEAHQSRVYSIAWRILGDTGTAEEVAQDVFLALYRNLERIDSEDHLLAWLRRVTVQRATDAIRRRGIRPEFGADEFLEQRTARSFGAANRLHAFGEPEAGNIGELVAGLPLMQRTIVLLRYQEDMTPSEIAASMSMPVATVKSHLQRALRLLREQVHQTRKEPVHG